MSVANFKPEIWSTVLTDNLIERQDITSLFDRRYDGEVTGMGDTVHIQKFTDVNVGDYTSGSDVTIQSVTSTQVDVVINKQKYFAMSIDDVDAIQANISLDSPAIVNAGDGIRKQMNTDVLSDCLTGALTANILDAGAGADLDDWKEARRLIRNADGWEDGEMFAIVNPDIESDLLGNANIISANQYGDRTALINGEIGNLLGFRTIVSTSLANTGATPDQAQAIFMHRKACAFVMQKEFTVEATRMEKQFGDMLKGLALYGTKLVQPERMVVLTRNV